MRADLERWIETWRSRLRALKRDTYALLLACGDKRTPWYAKLTALVVVAYAFSPIDLLPYFIRAVGLLDDMLLIPLGVVLVCSMVPSDVLADCRLRADTAFVNEKPVFWTTAVVIVATIQAFRVEDTTGRKVYDPLNGQLDEHFRAVPPDRVADLEKGPDGKPARSLENVLRLRRPVVIVDEAHNVRTPLSFATLGKLQPSCILEFTATPDREKAPSNVLHRVSAAELKAAAMIKLPIRVVTRPSGEWARLLSDALTLRNSLEVIAGREGQASGEYLRPIALIQGRDVEHTIELKKHLVAEHGIPEAEIKICTGKLDELKDVRDLAAPDCPVRYILTVQKLREGWDCPFAYVLCSLQETRSATAIEQIVGRVLRLPKAAFKTEPALNEAYVFSCLLYTSPSPRD